MAALQNAITEHVKIIEGLRALEPTLGLLIDICQQVLKDNGTIYFMGNGGSAADAQHFAAELVSRFKRERRALSAQAFTTDTSILTAIANDYGFENIFSRQVQARVTKQDMVIGISTSGKSENVRRALLVAKKIGASTAALLGGDGGKILEWADVALLVPSYDTARIQEAHILLGHTLCEELERLEMANDKR